MKIDEAMLILRQRRAVGILIMLILMYGAWIMTNWVVPNVFAPHPTLMKIMMWVAYISFGGFFMLLVRWCSILTRGIWQLHGAKKRTDWCPMNFMYDWDKGKYDF